MVTDLHVVIGNFKRGQGDGVYPVEDELWKFLKMVIVDIGIVKSSNETR